MINNLNNTYNIYMCKYICICICKYIYICVCMCVCVMCVCMCVCMWFMLHKKILLAADTFFRVYKGCLMEPIFYFCSKDFRSFWVFYFLRQSLPYFWSKKRCRFSATSHLSHFQEDHSCIDVVSFKYFI